MTTTSQDWALAGTLLALGTTIMSATYAALFWYVLGSRQGYRPIPVGPLNPEMLILLTLNVLGAGTKLVAKPAETP
jgi:hypothetical protein